MSNLIKSRSNTELQNLERIREEYRDNKKELTKVKRNKFVRCIIVTLILVAIPFISLSSLFLQKQNITSVPEIRRSVINNGLDNPLPSTILTNLAPLNNPIDNQADQVIGNNHTNTLRAPQPFYSKEELDGIKTSKIDNPGKLKPVVQVAELTLNDKELQNSLPKLNNLKSPLEQFSPSDHAVFLHFPKTGGTTTKNILGVCHKKVLASEAGIKNHASDEKLAVIKGYGDSLFVNIDPTTPEGIKRAYNMDFADKHLDDVTVTPFLYAIDNLFTPESKGRVFSMFRHPIERAVSMLNYIKYAEWEPSFIDEFKTMTLEEYAKSPYVENNFYTRVLSNTMEGSLTDDHFEIAIYHLQNKILVGLLDKLDESLNRFETYFGWKYSYNPAEQEKCRQDYIENGANVGKVKPVPVPPMGSEGYELLAWQNQYDLKLYNLVLKMFTAQDYLVAGMPSNYRLVDASCSSCVKQ